MKKELIRTACQSTPLRTGRSSRANCCSTSCARTSISPAPSAAVTTPPAARAPFRSTVFRCSPAPCWRPVAKARRSPPSKASPIIGGLAALQKAYGDFGGAQCGFCTPGFMMTVKWLLANNPDPSEDEIRDALSSNLCRCTGYSQMYQAIRAAIDAEQKGMKQELAEASECQTRARSSLLIANR